MLGGEVIGYQVEVKELQHKDGTKDVVSVDITDFNTKLQEAFLNEGLSESIQLFILRDIQLLNTFFCLQLIRFLMRSE